MCIYPPFPFPPKIRGKSAGNRWRLTALYHNWYTYNKNRDIQRQSGHTIYTYQNKHKNSRGKYHTQHEILHIQNLALTICTPRNIILNAGHTMKYVGNVIPMGCGSALPMKKPHRLTLVGFFFACTDPIITKCCVLCHSLRTSRTTQNNSFCIIGGGSLPTNEPYENNKTSRARNSLQSKICKLAFDCFELLSTLTKYTTPT